jgi:hypothetical protein
MTDDSGKEDEDLKAEQLKVLQQKDMWDKFHQAARERCALSVRVPTPGLA